MEPYAPKNVREAMAGSVAGFIMNSHRVWYPLGGFDSTSEAPALDDAIEVLVMGFVRDSEAWDWFKEQVERNS